MSKSTPKGLTCSFCLKTDAEVPSLIAGPGVHICGDCVGVCNAILKGLPAEGFGNWSGMDEDVLLANLPRAQSASEGARTVLQQQIEELRRRDVSWAKIGEALGVSRQAAWERYG
jgi:ATP-dependent Clp protease ATP-binding subunit ClpX